MRPLQRKRCSCVAALRANASLMLGVRLASGSYAGVARAAHENGAPATGTSAFQCDDRGNPRGRLCVAPQSQTLIGAHPPWLVTTSMSASTSFAEDTSDSAMLAADGWPGTVLTLQSAGRPALRTMGWKESASIVMQSWTRRSPYSCSPESCGHARQRITAGSNMQLAA